MARKAVLITGCNPGGIGNYLAREFHAHGLQVFATARKTASINDLALIGIETFSLEVTSDESILALRESVTSKTNGRLDYLINNAGMNYTVPALDINIEEARAMFDVNLFGVMRICQVFAPLVIEAKGTIAQIGSLAGIVPYVYGSAYNASKAALHAYSDTLRVELEPFNVKVVTVVTGGVKSNIARTIRTLPANSIYLPASVDYERRLQHSQEVGMPTEKYAKSVAKQVLGRPGRRIWQGNYSYIVWFVHMFVPHRVLELYFWWVFKLWKLKDTWQSTLGNTGKQEV